MSDYYAALDLPSLQLHLDLANLEQRFHAASRRLHPDRFARASAAEQQAALDASSVLNDAYRTLRDPLRRAEYALKLAGFNVGEQGNLDVPASLLEEVFEFNLALEEADADEVAAARNRFVALRGEIDARMEELFAAYDAAPKRETLEELRGLLNRRRYVANLISTASGEGIRH
ncbi:MAG: Fe-S protein assembly co-chaperone HscB [Bryobacteraceae bacterium]|nr:Fe-S protein assembly co-chaperone HscB [Bryobacteraceae bacterium]